MSELLDKQVNAQKENFRGSRKPTKKVCDENERNKQRRKKNDARVKILLMEGGNIANRQARPKRLISAEAKKLLYQIFVTP